MRKVFNQLVLAGSFSGCIFTASVGVCQQTINWPWLAENRVEPVDPQAPVRQVAWDQLPAPAANNSA